MGSTASDPQLVAKQIGARSRKLPVDVILFSMMFLSAGITHFAVPDPFVRIVPPFLPFPLLLVQISGAAEIAGGVGLLIAPLRRAAACGLIALLVSVFPANIYMAVAHVSFPGFLGQVWFQWLRLPIQIPLIWWAWQYAKVKSPEVKFAPPQ